MGKKSSILIICLWIMLLLSLFAVGLGHRAAINLKLTRYQRDSLKARYLALAGAQKAIAVLKAAPASPNYLNETWSSGIDADKKNIFKEIKLDENSGDSFSIVSGTYNNNEYYIQDEESKINININQSSTPLDKEMLRELFEFAQVNKPDELRDLLVRWTSPEPASPPPIPEEKAAFKYSELKIPEELLPILEYFYKTEEDPKQKAAETYKKVADIITVFGDGKININTAGEDVLGILINSGAAQVRSSNLTDLDPAGLLESVMNVRNDPARGFFYKTEDLGTKISGQERQTNVYNQISNISNKISVNSNYFRFIAEGSIAGSQTKRRITCVINGSTRTEPKIRYWHEN
ncbi:MAG: type II secretion system protein GspK [Candidatus Omnitrophota bacterium]|nr:type II secretion system protein GspK [Candidatus Omnitrophota bacterium]